MNLLNFFVGTSGWSYAHWKDIFYPKGLASKDYLQYYTTFFQAVELNASFYRLPKPETVLNWKEKTPESFHFSPKLSRLITHIKRLKGCEELLRGFMTLFEPLKEKLGPILIQLPPKLAYSEEASSFFSFLQKEYPSFVFAIEARHESWMRKELLQEISSYGHTWVIADSGKSFPMMRAATAKTVYFRFHGPSSLYGSNYTEKDLAPYVSDAKDALSEGRDVWAFFNNDFNGYAVKNALLFKQLVETR